ncbi:MAG: hypothetical protein WBD20_26265 [Pirellulaceae bacterium]
MSHCLRLNLVALLLCLIASSSAVGQNQFPAAPQLQPPITQPPQPTPQVAPQPGIEPAIQPTDPQQSLPPFEQAVNPPAQQPFTAPSANLASSLPAGLGVTAGSFSAAPTMIGDFFGGGLSSLSGSQTVSFSRYARANNISGLGGPGSPNSVLAFEVGSDTIFDDLFSTGTGTDVAGGGDGADTFSITEPVPPSDAPTAPGPGFVFNGGTAVYTNNTTDTTAQPGVYADGDNWFLQYSYTSTIGETVGSSRRIALPAPGNSTRRVKLSENFSPEVRDRVFFNYNFFNDSFGGLGDISRYVLGIERLLCEDVSFEARLPVAGTYASSQDISGANDRDFEVGNAVFILKAVLARTDNCLWTAGSGIGLPLADDTRIKTGERVLVEIENQTVRALPFTALMLRLNRDTVFQTYLQIDTALNGDTISADLTGQRLQRLGTFTDSTLMHLDAAISKSIYRNPRAERVKQITLNGELHYTTSLEGSDLVSGNGLTYTNLKDKFHVLNATTGFHFQLCNNLIVTPAMSIPLRDGLDKQFDYEAIVQVNYLR